MKKVLMLVLTALGVAAFALSTHAPARAAGANDWSLNATIIEACSCPMFCQCYFNAKPAGHSAMSGSMAGMDHGDGEHYCRANNVFKVNKGSYKGTKLDGAKFWIAMDLGDDFSDGTMKWAVITFDPSVTPAQRAGITDIIGHVYPVKWETPVAMGADAPIEWTHQGDKAWALLDGGKAGEVRLDGSTVMRDKKQPTIIQNLHYWGAPRNDGFVLMPNSIETYKLGPNAFEFKGTNGFMITLDINSNDVMAANTTK